MQAAVALPLTLTLILTRTVEAAVALDHDGAALAPRLRLAVVLDLVVHGAWVGVRG